VKNVKKPKKVKIKVKIWTIKLEITIIY